MSQIIQHQDTNLTSLAELSSSARIYAEQAKSANTVRAYRNDWRDFTAWCTMNNLWGLPADVETVALYLTA